MEPSLQLFQGHLLPAPHPLPRFEIFSHSSYIAYIYGLLSSNKKKMQNSFCTLS